MTRVAGDRREQAFEDLVAEVYRPVQRYLLRRTGPGGADDVLGDVLLVLWRRFDDVPAEARLAWCFGVARGCLANQARADRRRHRLVDRLADAARTAVEPGEDPALGEALDRLREPERELLRLWAWEQLAPREIAVVLGISPNAASIRLHRALGRLRAQLAGRKSGPAAGHVPRRQGHGGPG